MQHARRRGWIDKIGAGASAVCAVHCVLTGVALGLLSTAGFGFLASRTAELVFLSTAIVVGVIALWHGSRFHRSFVPALFFIGGLAFIALGHFVFGGVRDAHGHIHGPSWFNVAGGICLVMFHTVNLRLQHQRGCCHDAHCSHRTNKPEASPR